MKSGWRAGGAWLLSLALAGQLLAPAGVRADSDEERRIGAGIKIFRSLLMADLDLAKKTDDQGRLLVVFFFTDRRARAQEQARSFGKLDQATVVEEASDPTLAAYEHRPPAGIFLTQAPNSDALRTIVRFGIAHHVIVYSPFEGHVESGVLGGLSIEAQVRPYLNLTTLKASNISVREFFLKVAKVFR